MASKPKKFLIRSYRWAYNDECYFSTAHTVGKSYTTKEAAEKALNKEWQEVFCDIELEQSVGFMDGGTDVLNWLEEFANEKAGMSYSEMINALQNRSDKIKLSNDEYAEIGRRAGIDAGQVIEIPDNKKLSVLWDPHQDYPIQNWSDCGDDYGKTLYFGESEQSAVACRKSEIRRWQITHSRRDQRIRFPGFERTAC